MTADNRQQIQFDTIEWLRFFFIILVIIIHNFQSPASINLLEIDFSQFTAADFYSIFRAIVRQFAGICNWGFFIFAGYLFFLNVKTWNKATYLSKLKSRISTLLIPYVCWNIISVCTTPIAITAGRIIKQDGEWHRLSEFVSEIIDKGVYNIFWHYNTWGDGINILGREAPSMGPFSIPLWFLQTLIVLSICTPLIYLLIKYLKIHSLTLLGILYITGIWFYITPGFNIGAIFYFSLGAYFGISKKNLIFELRRVKIPCFLLFAATWIPAAILTFNGKIMFNYLDGIFHISATLSIIIIASYLIEKKYIKPNETLSQSTFFIYTSHTGLLVLPAVGVIFDIICFNSQLPVILSIRYIAVPVVCSFVCAGICLVLKKIMPKVANVLSGRRT